MEFLFRVLSDDGKQHKFCLFLQSPEVQIQVLGLQDVYGRTRGSSVKGVARGSEATQWWVWSGKDVVNAELDL